MTNANKGALLLILLFFTACKQEKSYVPNKLQVKQVKETFDLKNKWLIDGHVDSLKQIIHEEAVYGHSNCWVETYEDLTSVDTTTLDYIDVIVDDLEIFVVGQTGVIKGSGQFIGLYKQDTFDLNLCFVETYAFAKNKWKLVVRQSAKVPDEIN